MSWLFLATAAQALNAVVAMVDKYIVSDKGMVPRPFVYAFYSSLLTSAWGVVYLFGAIPWFAARGAPQLSNVEVPTIQVVGMSFLAAYTFFMALVSMFNALKRGDASDVMPVIGSVSAIATFGFAYLLLGARSDGNVVWGIALLATGTFLVSRLRFHHREVILSMVHSGFFFALHFIAMKGLFLETSFDDGFFWSRVGFVLFALSLLLVPSYFEKITTQFTQTSGRAGAFVVGNKVLAGVASFLLLKATDMATAGTVAAVQATDGLKFVFLLLFSVVVARFFPESAGEHETLRRTTFLRKALYVTIIAAGVFMLFS